MSSAEHIALIAEQNLSEGERNKREGLAKRKPRIAEKLANVAAMEEKGEISPIIRIEKSYLCNFQCSHCSAEYYMDRHLEGVLGVKEDRDQMTLEDIRDISRQADELGLARFVITGGEPLVQQKALLKFLDYMEVEWGWTPRIDFETNATILPDKEWKRVDATFTTSPKMSNNGDPEDRRYKRNVLDWHSINGSGFKFVTKFYQFVP